MCGFIGVFFCGCTIFVDICDFLSTSCGEYCSIVSDYLNGVITGVANIYCIIVPRFYEKTFSKYFAMISNCSFLFEVSPMESLWSLLLEPQSEW